MDDEQFAAIDAHLDQLFGGTDAALDNALDRADTAQMPPIAVSANLGRFLQVLALARGARTILEVGTLAGYSTIWLARALPADGRLITLEVDARHAEVARANLADAGVGDRVEIRVGAALGSLEVLEQEQAGPFDLVFIDADKEPYADYLDAAVRLGAPGTLIVADNVVRGGATTDDASNDARVDGVRRFNAALASHPGLAAAAIVQVVGSKGHDGLGFGVVAPGEL